MEADTSTMRNKIEEMDAAQIMMERFVTRAENEIQILTYVEALLTATWMFRVCVMFSFLYSAA